MGFDEDSLKAKLSSLNETQESISSVGQWLLFHRRHAEKIVGHWSQRVKDSPPNKRLTLIYLANEVVQQSKIRKKEEFLKAFDPVVAPGTTAAYKGSPPEVQTKIRRVVDVWKSRQCFRAQVLDEIERSLEDIDRSRATRKPLGQLGGSIFSGPSIPAELKPVEPLAATLQKTELVAKPAVNTANQDYERVTNSNASPDSFAKHAAALAALFKNLAVAENAVADSIKARQALVTGLEKLLETNRTKLAEDQALVADLGTRKAAIEDRRSQVETAILQNLPSAEKNKISSAPLPSTAQSSLERPQIEALTPPPMESFTPVGSPTLRPDVPDVPDDVFREPPANPLEPVAVDPPEGQSTDPTPATAIGAPNAIPGADLLQSLAHAKPADENGVYDQRTYKKRKMSQNAAQDDFAAFEGDAAMNGIDSTLGDLI